METHLHSPDTDKHKKYTPGLARKYIEFLSPPELIFNPQVRLLNAFRFVLRSERSRTPITPAQLFQPLITESHGSIMELDYNIHSKLSR